MPLADSVLVALAGAFYVVWGLAWLRSDGDRPWARGVRRITDLSTGIRVPRDAPFGFVPGGVGILMVGTCNAISREAGIAAFYCALALSELALVLTWRPPARLKPRWVRNAEATGARPVRMDAWDRGLTVLGLVAVPSIGAIMTLLLAIGPPASPGW